MIPNEYMEDDTIPVREYERFNEEKVIQYLQGKLPGVDKLKLLHVRQFGGGAANLTYLLDFKNKEYVLRRPPIGPIAKTSHDMEREYKVLSVLHKSFPLAPKAYLYCDDPSIMETPFFIMERKKGIVIRNQYPNEFNSISNSARLVSKALVDALVEFHTVNYRKLGLEDLGRPVGFIDRQIEGWYQRWNKAKLEDNPMMDEVYQWLRENRPSSTDHSLVHNDYKLDNVMFDHQDPSKIVAIFDWDMCTLGDPLSDLGALLTYWTEPSDPEYMRQIAMMPTEDLGFMKRGELVKRYAMKSGRNVDNINFYHALGLFRLIVIIAQIYIRFVRGQTRDKRFASLGQMIPLVIRTAWKIANS